MRLTKKTGSPTKGHSIYEQQAKLKQLEDIEEEFEIDNLDELRDRLTKYKFLANHNMSCVDVDAHNLMLKDLEEYHKIEGKLGIDLITLFKALDKTQRIFVLNEYDMRVVELPVRYASRNLVDGEIFINVSGCFANFEIKDYGKWWALTKEELE